MLREFGPSDTDRILRNVGRGWRCSQRSCRSQRLVGHKITQKWIFVDFLWLFMQRRAAGAEIDVEKAAASYLTFEEKRREFNSRPEELIRENRHQS